MLTIEFINVGYGDAVLIRETGCGNFSMLVDCGDVTVGEQYPGSQRVTAAEFLHKRNISHLDLLVLTHLHLDHSGGLTHLLPDVEITEFWTNYLPDLRFCGKRLKVPDGFSPGSKCLLKSMNIYLQAMKELKKQGTKVHVVTESKLAVSISDNFSIDVFVEDMSLFRRQNEIWRRQFTDRPNDSMLRELDGFINNTSIRMRLNYCGCAVELPGDIYADCWEKHRITPCAIAKLPHHGHRDSFSKKLYDMLKMKYVVASVSNSRLDDFPSSEIIELVRQNSSTIFFTDAVRVPYERQQFQQALQFVINEDGALSANRVDRNETIPI